MENSWSQVRVDSMSIHGPSSVSIPGVSMVPLPCRFQEYPWSLVRVVSVTIHDPWSATLLGTPVDANALGPRGRQRLIKVDMKREFVLAAPLNI